MNDMELAEEIERALGERGEWENRIYATASLAGSRWQQIIAALRRGHEPDVEPFCWWRTTRDITDEYVTVYSDDGVRPKGDGWKPLYERPPSGEMVMVPRAAPKPLLAELAKCHHTRLDQRRISAAQTVWARLLGLALSAVEAEGRKS